MFAEANHVGPVPYDAILFIIVLLFTTFELCWFLMEITKPLWAELSKGSRPASCAFSICSNVGLAISSHAMMCFSCKSFSVKETYWAADWVWVSVHRMRTSRRKQKTVFFLFFDATRENTSRFPNNNINNGDWQPPYRRLSAPTVVEIVYTERSLYGLP